MSELNHDAGYDLANGRVADFIPRDDFVTLTHAARDGCAESLGQLVDRCRNYLLLVANRGLNPDLRVKVGASDLVQETLLAAQRGFDRFEGSSDAELRLWLRRILLNKMASATEPTFKPRSVRHRASGRCRVRRIAERFNRHWSIRVSHQAVSRLPENSPGSLNASWRDCPRTIAR